MPGLIGQSLGRYHILEQLGEGGMATVYKAYDTRLERDVAVKVIRVDQFAPAVLERILKRFEREAKSLARLTHPNIVHVNDYGDQDDIPYLVMDYLPGGTLKQRLGKPMPWQESVKLLLPVAEALDYAHEQNIIHRDVKPSNILLTQRGQPMLTDFGIAKIIDEEATVDLTGTSATVGTPEYMAPEQVVSKNVDHRADIYALGVVFYEMVTGRKPFQADTPMAVLFKHVSEPLPRPKQFVTDLPDGVEHVLLKVLAKQPENRYQSMTEFANALDKLQREPTQTTSPEPPKPTVNTSPTTSELTTDQSTVLQEGTDEQVEAHPEPETLSNELPISLGGGVQMAFVQVPAGKFIMGSPDDEGDDDEHPQHEVYLDEYWMGKTPVTNAQYHVFVTATDRAAPQYWKNGTILQGKEDHPVVHVSWQDATAFCTWVSQLSGKPVRLPTETEWEKAARGQDGRKYPWGNHKPEDNLCNFNHSGKGETTPVGVYSPDSDSPYGCTDMAGNIWEWTADWYGDKFSDRSPKRNPQGPEKGNGRVLRGGSWEDDEYYMRCASRDCDKPSSSFCDVGFRCVLESPAIRNKSLNEYGKSARSDFFENKVEKKSYASTMPKKDTLRTTKRIPVKDRPALSGSTLKSCPKCKMKVLPKSDGTCPSCQSKIVT